MQLLIKVDIVLVMIKSYDITLKRGTEKSRIGPMVRRFYLNVITLFFSKKMVNLYYKSWVQVK